jgi:hypothetical protein
LCLRGYLRVLVALAFLFSQVCLMDVSAVEITKFAAMIGWLPDRNNPLALELPDVIAPLGWLPSLTEPWISSVGLFESLNIPDTIE